MDKQRKDCSTRYTTEYRTKGPTRLMLTTDKKYYDSAIKKRNVIPIQMVGDKKHIKACLTEHGEDLYMFAEEMPEQQQLNQEELSKALAFLFDRSEYKELIKQGKAEWPKILTEALEKHFNI